MQATAWAPCFSAWLILFLAGLFEIAWAIIKLSVHGVEAGGLPAVDLLEAQFERLSRPTTNQPD